MSEKGFKFSVIMPVFNVEKYIRKSVDSVLNQTYQNIEVLLVDDGSTDNCPKICDDYAELDSRVRVIHKKNGGLSDARNFGIDAASGDYVVFLDSDDYWSSDTALEKAARKLEMEKSDVMLFFFKYLFEDENNRITEYNSEFEKIEINMESKKTQLTDLIKNNIYISSAWAKIIKRQLFKDNDLYFVKGVYSEDIEWSARLMMCAGSFSVLNESFYIYIQRGTSIAHSLRRKNIVDAKNNVMKALAMADSIDEELKEAFMNYISYQYITVLNVSCVCKDDIRDEIRDMKNYTYLLDYHWNPKVKKIYMFNKIFGFSMMMKLLSFYIRKVR